ncbi:TetR/AcrR family transcriptional regulator [Kineosporia succinea]|uniref:AcrR family transcriptional regulator n=1 Tax=Kineosporia succinea TaxID=84632 RepID=A0ABT9NVU6_9ACTN|nr:TetR/AcrR family transcriptional regulator [Kineosporia succinea]MDP9824446.1 AcrR family transcriptional regulator [Kineosporia succinea]
MARTVDPARHQARRLQIIDAALTRFAQDGYDRATTTSICRTAGIGSGTFFHYFPTKRAVLLAVLDLGTAETAQWFEAQAGRADALQVVTDFAAHHADDCTDPRVAGFVQAVGAVMTEHDVAAALARDEDVLHLGLLPWVRAAAEAGEARRDRAPEQLTAWVTVLLNGYLDRLAGQRAFDARAEKDMLLDTVRRLLRP